MEPLSRTVPQSDSFANDFFARVEKKYIATAGQIDGFLSCISPLVKPDRYPSSDVNNIYYDTPERLLIRRSLDKPLYKEKLRLRCYGPAKEAESGFVELKKKYRGVVYKRRVALPYEDAEALLRGERPPATQIEREILYMFELYPGLAPAYFIHYHRDSYCGTDDPEIRITIDRDIRWREDRLDIREGDDGTDLLPEGMRILEMKVQGSMPLWLSSALDENRIRPTSFSKYGNAFRQNTQSAYYAFLIGGFCKS